MKRHQSQFIAYSFSSVRLVSLLLSLMIISCGNEDVLPQTSRGEVTPRTRAESTETNDSQGLENQETSMPEGSSDLAPRDEDGNCILNLRAEVRDESGPCESCNAGDYITVVGILENLCTTSLTYTSDLDCLVLEFNILNITAGSSSEYPMTCGNETHTEDLTRGATIEKTRPAGRLSAGSYTLSVNFGDSERTQKELAFIVE